MSATTLGETAAMLATFTKQVGWCNGLGAPFTAEIVAALAADIASGGPAARLVASWPADPAADAVPLRLAGGLHALVLRGDAPGLAACYPPHTAGDPATLRTQLGDTLARHEAYLGCFMASPPQTNEVGRSAVLLGGFLTVAQATRLPLHLLEIGASAGLNLLWDRYCYRLGTAEWGDPASPVLIAPQWHGPPPPLGASLHVAERAGCDIAPLDLGDEATCLRLRAYVWPDQPERLARLEAAITVARAFGAVPERADAATWVLDRLAKPDKGAATVLFHSIMWQYMPLQPGPASKKPSSRAGPGPPSPPRSLGCVSNRQLPMPAPNYASPCGPVVKKAISPPPIPTAPPSPGSQVRSPLRPAAVA